VVERVVIVRQPVPGPSVSPPGPGEPVDAETPGTPAAVDFTFGPVAGEVGQSDYLRRRQEVLRWGVDALPPPTPRSPPSPQPLTPGTAHEKLLDPSKLF
jgi:hypothetical protein